MLPAEVSFVGVDIKTDLELLKTFQDFNTIHLTKQPYIEWGVLVSPSRMGKHNRYPPLEFAVDFAHSPDAYNRSIHLCGSAVDDYLFRPDSEIGLFAATALARIQLNFSIDKYNQDELIQILMDRILIKKHSLILQYNKSKKKFMDKLLQQIASIAQGNPTTLSVLYDGSGGFGRVIEKFDPPQKGFYTGYAGGLNPENVESIVQNISKVSGNIPYYIDMESGIRTKDWLDLEKCKSIIQTLEDMHVPEIFE